MRGDRPFSLCRWTYASMFTPHARGSTWIEEECGEKRKVYPACAGIDLRQWFLDLFDKGLPRMRGDRPW